MKVLRNICGHILKYYHFTFIILSALIGSLTIGTTFFLSFLVGILSDKIGLRLTSVIGAVLATLGMGLSALLYRYLHNIYTHICNKYLHTHLQPHLRPPPRRVPLPHLRPDVRVRSLPGLHSIPHHPRWVHIVEDRGW